MRPHRPTAATSLFGSVARSRADRQRRLAAWARRVVPRLQALGLDVTACRASGARAVFVPEGHLGLRVDAEGVEVAVVLRSEEFAALRARLADPARALQIGAALAALPQQFRLGGASADARVPASGATTDALAAWLATGPAELWVGWSVGGELATLHGPALDGEMQDASVALGELLQVLLPPAPLEAGRPRERHRGATKDRDGHDQRRRLAKARARALDDDADEERAADREPAPEAERPAPRSLRPQAAARRVLVKPRRGAPSDAPLDKGARVRVLEGPFTGKVGHVQALDGKGGARVMLGLLAVHVSLRDLVACPEGVGRPRLSSSHRRPTPARS